MILNFDRIMCQIVTKKAARILNDHLDVEW
jgi:hypothetical protein